MTDIVIKKEKNKSPKKIFDNPRVLYYLKYIINGNFTEYEISKKTGKQFSTINERYSKLKEKNYVFKSEGYNGKLEINYSRILEDYFDYIKEKINFNSLKKSFSEDEKRLLEKGISPFSLYSSFYNLDFLNLINLNQIELDFMNDNFKNSVINNQFFQNSLKEYLKGNFNNIFELFDNLTTSFQNLDQFKLYSDYFKFNGKIISKKIYKSKEKALIHSHYNEDFSNVEKTYINFIKNDFNTFLLNKFKKNDKLLSQYQFIVMIKSILITESKNLDSLFIESNKDYLKNKRNLIYKGVKKEFDIKINFDK